MIPQKSVDNFRLRGEGYEKGQCDMLQEIAECRLRGTWTPKEHERWMRKGIYLLESIRGRPEYRRNQAYFSGQLVVLRSNKAKCYCSKSDRDLFESENVSGGKPVWEKIVDRIDLDEGQTVVLLIFEDDTAAIQLRYVGDALIPLDFDQAVKLGCALLAHTGSVGNEEEDVLEVFRRPTPVSRLWLGRLAETPVWIGNADAEEPVSLRQVVDAVVRQPVAWALLFALLCSVPPVGISLLPLMIVLLVLSLRWRCS